MIKLILVLFMASAMPASAGPVIAAIAMSLGASFATGIAISTFFGTVVGRVLLSVALGALKQVLAPKSKSGQSSGIQTNITQTGADQAVSWIMGKYATAGVMACPPMTHGKVDKTPNAYLTYVINLSDIPGMTLSRVAINGVWVDFSGTADASFGTPAVGEYAGYAWVKYYNGSQTAADPGLLAKYASYPDRPWTSDMIGLETCYAIMTFRIKSELYSGFPTVLFEVSGIPLYDPRKDTTVGGSGAHRWATRSTWEPSNNPFVQVYNILRGIQITATEYWGGQAEAADVPLTTWMTAMNACDAAVNLAAGGSEPAYRSGLEVFVKDEPASVIEQLLKGCAGDVCDIGGVWKARAGGVSLPVYTFTDDDVIITQSSTFDPFPAGLSGVYNAAVATYPEPISTYEIETSPQMLFPTFETEDRGQRLPASLSLPSVPYTNQVQRLCDAYVRDNRRFRRHSVPMPPAAMLLEPLDATAWTSGSNGYSGKVFEVEEIRDDIMSGIQGVSVRERDPADYSWSSTRELPTDPRPFTLVLPVAQSVPSWAVTGVSLVDAGSTARRPALRLAWNGSEQDDIAGIEFEIRLTGTVNVAHRASTTLLDASVFDYSAGILPNVSYEARGRFLSNNARNWSSWVSATTPDTGFTNADFGTVGAYTSLFISQGLYAIRDVTVLPGSGTFIGEKVFNRTDGKLYQWTGSVWKLMVADVAAGTVTTASFAAGIEPVEILGALPTTGNFQGRMVFLTTDNKMYRHTGTAFTRVTDGGDISAATLTAAAFAATIAPVEIFAALPTTGNFQGRTVFLTTDKKLYRHNGTAFITAVDGADISDATLTAAAFAASIAPVEILGALPVTGNFQGRTVFLTTDKKLYRYNGTAFTAAVDGADIVANTITAGQIAAGAISATEIAAGAITTTKLAIGDTSNMYPDPDMVDLAAYLNTGSATFSLTSSTYGSSKNKLVITSTGGTVDRFVLGPMFAVDEGLEYQIASKVGVEGSAPAVTATLQIVWYSDNAATVGISTTNIRSETTLLGRTLRATSIVVAPATARRAKIRFLREANATSPQNAVFNEIVIRRAAAGELIVDGAISAVKIAANTITAGQIAANTITAGQIAAGAISASKIVVSDPTNVYPDFDMLDTSFYTSVDPVTGGAVITFIGTSVAALGRQFMNVAVNAAIRSVESAWFNIEPGVEYLVAGSAFLSATVAGAGICTVEFETGSVGSTGVVTPVAGSRTVVSTRTDSATSGPSAVTITAGGSSRRGRFVVTRAAGGTGSGRAAAFKVQKKGTGALTVDGTITGLKIAANTITAANIAADTITAGQIAAGAISTSELAAGAVVAGKIAAGTIVAADIAAGTISGDKIVANTITGGLLAASGIITATAQIGNGLITNALIGGVIQSTNYVAGSTGWMIDKAGGAELNSLTVREDMIVNGAVSRKGYIYKWADTTVSGTGYANKVNLTTLSAYFNPVGRTGDTFYPDNPVLVTITGKLSSAGNGLLEFALDKLNTTSGLYESYADVDYTIYNSSTRGFTIRMVDTIGFSGFPLVTGTYRLVMYLSNIAGVPSTSVTISSVICTMEQLNK